MNYFSFGRVLLLFAVSKIAVVLQSDKYFCSFIHPFSSEGIFYPPDKLLTECSPPPAYLIDIASCNSIVAGMKVIGSFFNINNGDIGREPVVNPIFDFKRRKICIDFKMSYLPDCMNTAISASGAINIEFTVFKELPAGIQYFALDAFATLLHLPA